MSFITLMLYIASVLYVTTSLTEKEGPFDLFVWLRKLAGFPEGDYFATEVADEAAPFLVKLMRCFFCLSLWVTGLMYPLVHFELYPVLYVFGAAYLVSLSQSLLDKYNLIF